MGQFTTLIHKYLRHNKKFPHVWCPGCGNGIVLGALIRAIDGLGYDMDKIVLVSGIGCSGRLPVYVDLNTLHTTHGRALTFATGIKLANPELEVIVIMGDGDSLSIGGNHFIHAARRNIDLTAIIINNQIYGMTGGQHSAATPYGSMATSAPYSHIEQAFQISELAVTAGATYVARGTTFHVQMLPRLIQQASRKKGFGVVEVMSPCPTYFGRKNKQGTAVDIMNWQRDHAVYVDKAADMDAEALADKFTIGVLTDRDLPVYQDQYERIMTRAQEEK